MNYIWDKILHWKSKQKKFKAMAVNWLMQCVIIGIQGMNYLRSVTQAVLFIILTWVAIAMTCLLMAGIVTLTGCNMSWFTYSINMVGLFMIPGVITMISIQEILKHKVFQVRLKKIPFL